MKIEIDKEYRLLPNARNRRITLDTTTTRVRVKTGPDIDDEVYVNGLNGCDEDIWFYVLPKYLAPLDEPAPWAPGDPAIVTADRPYGADLYVGDRVAVTEVRGLAPEDTIVVVFVSGRGSDEQPWRLAVDQLCRPDAAPRCTYGADCQVHPDENQLHNYDSDDRIAELAARVEKLERRLNTVVERHHLADEW